jgi:hypothetical protein
VFEREPNDKDKDVNLLNSQECLFTQYVTYDTWPESTYSFNSFMAGPSQMVHGATSKQRVDCALVLPRGASVLDPSGASEGDVVLRRPTLIMAQYDGQFFHGDAPTDGCEKCSSSGSAACNFGLDPEDEDEEVEHRAGLSVKLAERNRRQEAKVKRDLFNASYAEALTAVGDLDVFYRVFKECDLFHARQVKSRKTGLSYSSLRMLLKKAHPDMSVLGLNPRKMTLESILSKLTRSDEELARFNRSFQGYVVIRGGVETVVDNASRVSFGFCVQKARPDVTALGDFTHFLHNKRCADAAAAAGSSADEAAPVSMAAARRRPPLSKLCEREQTLCKRSFNDDAVETLEASYFRFLVTKRGLSKYSVLHFIFFRKRGFLSPFLEKVLQLRHDHKLAGNTLGSLTSKLFLNSIFGYSLLNPTKHDRTTVNLESTLVKKMSKMQQDDLVNISFLGCVDKQQQQQRQATATGVSRKRRAVPSMLYAVTVKNKKARVENLVHIGACILSRSKELFLGKLLTLMTILKPQMCVVTYLDTDGVYLGVYDHQLENIMEDEYKDRAQEILNTLLENPRSLKHQTGFFKLEVSLSVCLQILLSQVFQNHFFSFAGRVQRRIFPMHKMLFYGARGFHGGSRPAHERTAHVRRSVRSSRITDSTTVVNTLSLFSRFHQALQSSEYHPNAPPRTVRYMALRPTEGLELCLGYEQKSCPTSINFKRVQEVKQPVQVPLLAKVVNKQGRFRILSTR